MIHLTKYVPLPDPVLLARYRRCPELGPKVLFFSGGTALRNACAELIQYTHNSIHIITPFDSGGSSAVLRDAFRIPAIGDIRNRLLSLADRSLHGYPEIYNLFAHRFPSDGDPDYLNRQLDGMIEGSHSLVSEIPDPMRKIIRRHLYLFKTRRPASFDLRKASIGNLILAAGYLDQRRSFDTIIYIFSKLVQVRGTVRPVVNRHLHLSAELETGETLVGQHLITGKECGPIAAKIEKVWLTESVDHPVPCQVSIRRKMTELIREADLICYPMGSFYSSLIANLLPGGVAEAIRSNPCPKIFIPNTGRCDPEAKGLDLSGQIRVLLRYLIPPDSSAPPSGEALTFVMMDDRDEFYDGILDETELKRTGIRVIRVPLVSPRSAPLIDEKLLIPLILSLT